MGGELEEEQGATKGERMDGELGEEQCATQGERMGVNWRKSILQGLLYMFFCVYPVIKAFAYFPHMPCALGGTI